MASQIKTVQIRGKNYVEVAERVRLVHDQQREFEVIESEPYEIGDRVLWKVTILVDKKAYKGNAEVKLNAAKNTPDGTNPFECAETSALGRALAFAGFGSVESIASLDEVYRAMSNQNTSETHQNDASASLAPTVRGLYQKGQNKGLWVNQNGFFDFAGTSLKIEVNASTKLTTDQKIQLDQAIDEAEPVSKAS